MLDAGSTRLPHFRVDLGRLDAPPTSWSTMTRAGLSRRSISVPFALAAFRRRRRRPLGRGRGRRLARTTRHGRARRSISRSSACCSTPAPDRTGAIATPSPAGHRPLGRARAREPRDVRARRCFRRGPSDPLRADARALEQLDDADALAQAFRSATPIRWSASTAAPTCCAASGARSRRAPKIFGRADEPRPGGLFDHSLRSPTTADRGRRPSCPSCCMHLGPIWPSRITLGGVALGDCWRHPAIRRDDADHGLVPFHKLSQWLAYSLIEPLRTGRHRGHRCRRPDRACGVPQRRPVHRHRRLAFRDPADAARQHDVDLAAGGRVARPDGGAARSPGGAGAHSGSAAMRQIAARPHSAGRHLGAGRVLAAKLRPDGGPPIAIVSDGTVF